MTLSEISKKTGKFRNEKKFGLELMDGSIYVVAALSWKELYKICCSYENYCASKIYFINYLYIK